MEHPDGGPIPRDLLAATGTAGDSSALRDLAAFALHLAGAVWVLLIVGYAATQVMVFVGDDCSMGLSSTAWSVDAQLLPPGLVCEFVDDDGTVVERRGVQGIGTLLFQILVVAAPLVLWRAWGWMGPNAGTGRRGLLRCVWVAGALIALGSTVALSGSILAGVVGMSAGAGLLFASEVVRRRMTIDHFRSGAADGP